MISASSDRYRCSTLWTRRDGLCLGIDSLSKRHWASAMGARFELFGVRFG